VPNKYGDTFVHGYGACAWCMGMVHVRDAWRGLFPLWRTARGE